MRELNNKQVLNTKYNIIEDIIDTTSNSIQIHLKDKKTHLDKETGNSLGTDCYQWFTEKEFYTKFKVI